MSNGNRRPKWTQQNKKKRQGNDDLGHIFEWANIKRVAEESIELDTSQKKGWFSWLFNKNDNVESENRHKNRSNGAKYRWSLRDESGHSEGNDSRWL